MKKHRLFKTLLVILAAIIAIGIAIGVAGSANASPVQHEALTEGDDIIRVGGDCGPYYTLQYIFHEAVPAVYERQLITAEGWQRYSWTGGPHGSDEAPSWPSDDWQANVAGDPHGIGAAGAYFRSNGNSGNGDWFYLEYVAAVYDIVMISDNVGAWTETIITDYAGEPCNVDEDRGEVEGVVPDNTAPVITPVVESPVVVTASAPAASPVVPAAQPAPVRVLQPSFTG